MKRRINRFQPYASITAAAIATVVTNHAYAQTRMQYDGQWQAKVSCSESIYKRPPLNYSVKIAVKNNQINGDFNNTNGNVTNTSTWRGQITPTGAKLEINGFNSIDEKWRYSLQGPVASNSTITLVGPFFDKSGNITRTCSMSLSIIKDLNDHLAAANGRPAIKPQETSEQAMPTPKTGLTSASNEGLGQSTQPTANSPRSPIPSAEQEIARPQPQQSEPQAATRPATRPEPTPSVQAAQRDNSPISAPLQPQPTAQQEVPRNQPGRPQATSQQINPAETSGNRQPSAQQTPAPKAPTQPEFKEVVSKGIGNDIELAIKNAAENALAQVVGTFIDAEEQVKKKTEIMTGIRNETKALSSNIRSYSQGSIQSVEVLNAEDKNGFKNVEAKFVVRVEDFKAFIKRAAIGETRVSTGTFAQMSAAVENEKNAQEILVETIIKPLMNAEVIRITVGKPSPLKNSSLSYVAQDPSSISAPDLVKPMRMRNATFFTESCRFDPNMSIVANIQLEINPDFYENMLVKAKNIAIEERKFIGLRDRKWDANKVGLALMDNPSREKFNVFYMKNNFNGNVNTPLEELFKLNSTKKLIATLKDSSGEEIAQTSDSNNGICPQNSDFKFLLLPTTVEGETEEQISNSIRHSPGIGASREKLLYINFAIQDVIWIRRKSSVALVMQLSPELLRKTNSISVTYGD